MEEVKYIDGVSSNEDSDEEEVEKDDEEAEEKSNSSEEIVDTFRVIGLRRKAGESLVINVYWEDLQLYNCGGEIDNFQIITVSAHP